MTEILDLLGMYFDAAVVEVKTFFTFIQIDCGHTVMQTKNSKTENRLKTPITTC